ncbi:hypothetical protein GCM10025856_22530 [Methylophaga marina]|nr:hypothetical protein GCM10025856_22530 [Methylophaga marina]
MNGNVIKAEKEPEVDGNKVPASKPRRPRSSGPTNRRRRPSDKDKAEAAAANNASSNEDAAKPAPKPEATDKPVDKKVEKPAEEKNRW